MAAQGEQGDSGQPRNRGGRSWAAPRGSCREINDLVWMMRRWMGDAVLTVAEVHAHLTPAHFASGEVPELRKLRDPLNGHRLTWELVEAVADACSPDGPAMQVLLVPARALWNQAHDAPTPAAVSASDAAELQAVKDKLLAAYDRIEGLRQAAHDAGQARERAENLAVVLYALVARMQNRITDLERQCDALRTRPAEPAADPAAAAELAATERRLHRAQDQHAAAVQEQRRAERERDDARQVADRAVRTIAALQAEVEQLRAHTPAAPDTPPDRPGDDVPVPALALPDPGDTELDEVDEVLARARDLLDEGRTVIDAASDHLDTPADDPAGHRGTPGPGDRPSPPTATGDINTVVGEVITPGLSRTTPDNPPTSNYPPPHDILNARHQRARDVGERGDRAEAAHLFAAVAADAARELGPNHLATLAARHEHAYNMGESGDRTGAAQLFEALAADYAQGSGPNHLATLNARHEHAYYLGESGDRAGAAALFEALTADWAQGWGPNHIETLNARYHHAYNLGESGKRVAATELFSGLAEDWAQVLGPDHPDTLNARYHHAYNVGESGDRAEAAQLFAAVAKDWAQVLGPDHLHTLAARHEHARNLGVAGDRAQAAALLEAVARDRARVLGPDHPDTLEALHQHAYNVGRSGDRGGAPRRPIKVAGDQHIQMLGADHPDSLKARYLHAYHLGESGDRAEAARLLEALAADCARVLGPDHPDTLAARRGYGRYRDALPSQHRPEPEAPLPAAERLRRWLGLE